MTTDSDEVLVEAAQNGGHGAYIELCQRHRGRISHIVHRITKNSHDTEDVIQDAWMKAFIHIRTFDHRSAFSTWLTRIAINSALMLLRKRRWHLEDSLNDEGENEIRGPLEIVEPSNDPETSFMRIEAQLRLRQAIERLSPKLRQVAEFRQSQDGSIRDIAMMTGLSVSAAKSRLTRAKCVLRQTLDQR